MTPEQRAECERFVELQRAATDGLWFWCDEIDSVECDMDSLDGVPREATTTIVDLCPNGKRDGHFIVASHTVPIAELLDENARLQAELDAINRDADWRRAMNGLTRT